MGLTTVFKKGTAKEIQARITSPRLAHRLSRAFTQIENNDIEKLVRIGKVKRIHTVNGKEYFIYRATPTERIVFSSADGKNYILDVVSANHTDGVYSLLSAKEG